MKMMKTNLTQASNQWSARPADERYWTLSELYDKTRTYANESKLKTLELSKCRVTPDDGDLRLVGPQGGAAQFQHYSFGQFSNVCGAPASYLRSLPAELAAANLNHGLSQVGGEHVLMFRQNGGLYLRCLTSSHYERIWNYEIAELALNLESEGWVVPPARSPVRDPGECSTRLNYIPTRIATEKDVLRNSAHPNLGIKVGDTIAPSGLYASDHDSFIFQVNESRPIESDGETMYRGVFWSNSEVGSAKFRGTMFLYDSVCGNHIVWGAKVVAEISIRHMGNARVEFARAMQSVTRHAELAASEDVKRIESAKHYILAPNREDTIEMVFKKQLGLGRKECEEAYSIAERYEGDHGKNPRSAWGFAAGVTRLSQGQPYMDQRDRLDRAAGKLLSMAF